MSGGGQSGVCVCVVDISTEDRTLSFVTEWHIIFYNYLKVIILKIFKDSRRFVYTGLNFLCNSHSMYLHTVMSYYVG